MAKKNFVTALFNDIAPTYDKLNHILSLSIDKSWRRRAVNIIKSKNPTTVLDVACGTGDFSIALAQAGVPQVEGIDISEGMMQVGRKKVADLDLSSRIAMHLDDCESLSLADGSVDAVSVAFGVRNFEHLEIGLKEMCRVLHKDGQLVILELSVPENPVLLFFYKIYFLHILPFIGGLVSGNKMAYKYLPISVLNFPKPAVMLPLLKQCGFETVSHEALTFGLCRIYTAIK